MNKKHSKNSLKVIIVGAGASGLYAGYMLNKLGVDFTILEADAIHGGRIGKFIGFADYDIDIGGQWLHGLNNIVGELIQNKGVSLTLDDTPYVYYFKNKIVKNLPKNPFIFEDGEMPDISFKNYAKLNGFSSSYNEIINSIAGFSGADADEISTLWNYLEVSKSKSGEGDYKFENTYFDILDNFFTKSISDKILYNQIVKEINYMEDKVEIRTTEGIEYNAAKVLITVPITILKSEFISFTPALPESKIEAFSKIGMGPGLKVFLKFKKEFYPDNIIGSKVCSAYFNDTTGKKTKDSILIAFIMGKKAKVLCELTDDMILESIVQELDLFFTGKASQNLLDFKVFNFSKKIFIKGAYSYSTIGMGNAREIAAQSLNNKLYFAGEAMNVNGNHQTIHGAMESSKIAIENMFS